MSTLFDVIGLPDVWVLSRAYPGVRLSIPTKCAGDAFVMLRDMIGESLAIKLIANFGGENIWVPKLAKIKLALRNKRIAEEVQGGATINAVALKHGLTDRQVYNVLRKARDDDPNLDHPPRCASVPQYYSAL